METLLVDLAPGVSALPTSGAVSAEPLASLASFVLRIVSSFKMAARPSYSDWTSSTHELALNLCSVRCPREFGQVLRTHNDLVNAQWANAQCFFPVQRSLRRYMKR